MQLAALSLGTIEKLKQANIDNPQLDARLLICHALRCDRIDLLSQSHRVLTSEEIAAIEALITRRLQREPVARILGQREFWGLPFGLNEATPEPRPDSETLIETVLSLSRPCVGAGMTIDHDGDNPHILDLGAGTGCLLLSLLHEIPTATGIGIDTAPRAVEQAIQNALSLGLEKRAKFIVRNWCETITERFDIIICNPPYISAADIPNLMPEVRNYDPALALNGGEDGLDPYRFLIPQLTNFLKPNGIAIFETGIDQAQQVTDLFCEYGFVGIETHKDLGGVERCISAICRN